MLRQVQILVGAFMGSLLIIALAVGLAFPEGDRLAAPPLWLVGAQVAAGLVVHLLVEAIGYRARPVAPGQSGAAARRHSASAFMSGTILRLGLCESIALASVAASFLVEEGGFVGLLTGAGVSLALMTGHAWPGPGPIGKAVTSLEREGGRSYLREHLGLGTLGPIQEL